MAKHHARKTELPVSPLVALGNGYTEAMSRGVHAMEAGAKAWRQEMQGFVSRRLARDSSIVEQSAPLQNPLELLALQGGWSSELFRDYWQEFIGCSRLRRRSSQPDRLRAVR
jgi:hypothetical protein